MLTYTLQTVKELSGEDYLWCYRHNLGGDGQMREALVEHRHGRLEWNRVVILWNDDVRVGWMLMFKQWEYYRDRNNNWRNNNRTHCAYFYIPPKERRKGYGTQLYKVAREICGKKRLKTWGWDDRSEDFFNKVYGKKMYKKTRWYD